MATPKAVIPFVEYEKLKERSRLYRSENSAWLKVFNLCQTLGMVKSDDESNLEGLLAFVERECRSVKALEKLIQSLVVASGAPCPELLYDTVYKAQSTLKICNGLLDQWQQRAEQEREKRAELEAENEAIREEKDQIRSLLDPSNYIPVSQAEEYKLEYRLLKRRYAELEAENEAIRRGNIDLIAQVKELEADRKRLDWVESIRPNITEMKDNSVQVRTVVDRKEPAYKGMTVRKANDTAMRAEGVGREGTPDAL